MTAVSLSLALLMVVPSTLVTSTSPSKAQLNLLNSRHNCNATTASPCEPPPAVRYEPGGWGAFLALERHPQNSAVWLAGADVGGLFISTDDGETWGSCTDAGLLPATLWVMSIAFVGDPAAPLLGTSAGLFRGVPVAPENDEPKGHRGSKRSCGGTWTFVPSNEGLLQGNYSTLLKTSGFAFLHSVRALAVAAQPATAATAATTFDRSRRSIPLVEVWAGIGIQKNLGSANPKVRCGDLHHVYRSVDGGAHWLPVLALAQAGTVMSIAAERASPRGETSVYVATAVGLYGSEDSGSTWVELGVHRPRWSRDGGVSWKLCPSPCPALKAKPCIPLITARGGGGSGIAHASEAVGTATAANHTPGRATPPRSSSQFYNTCLPIATAVNETSPNTRKVVVVGSTLWVTVWDAKPYPTTESNCHTKPDPNLTHFRGGPWRSTDGGSTWSYLFAAAAAGSGGGFQNASIRCPDTPDHYAGTQFPELLVDPSVHDHLFLGGWAQGQGLSEIVGDGNVIGWNNCGSESGDFGCYEGRRPDSMMEDTNTYTFGFGADWSSMETRVITNGTVIGSHGRTSGAPSVGTAGVERVHGTARRALVWITTSRGALRSAWDPTNGRYSYKHFNNDLLSMDATPPLWQTTGLGDTCAWGSVCK
jgi:hypothetical protein